MLLILLICFLKRKNKHLQRKMQEMAQMGVALFSWLKILSFQLLELL
jgi:hypothetical protein